MTIGEFLAEQGKRTSVYCGCIGWVSGYPRATRGLSARSPDGTCTYYRCLGCGKAWRRAVQSKTPAVEDDTLCGSRHAAVVQGDCPDGSGALIAVRREKGNRKSADPRAAGATSPRGAQPLPPQAKRKTEE